MNNKLRNKYDRCFDLIRRIPTDKLSLIDRTEKTIKDLKVGSFIRLLETQYLITEKYYYHNKRGTRINAVEYQITDPLTGNVQHIEYTEDETIQMYITIKEVGFDDLMDILYGLPLEFNTVMTFSSVYWDKQIYPFNAQWGNVFTKMEDNSENKELVKMVEFKSEEEESFLTFEFWDDGTTQAFISERLNEEDVEVIAI